MTESQKHTVDATPADVAETVGAHPGATNAPGATSRQRVDRSTPASPAAAPGGADVDGKTIISDGVIAKVAGIAAREVPGVHALGGGGARAFGAIRDAVNATDLGQGVKVEVGETQAAADITIVVAYPAPIHQVAANVRAAVAGAISQLAGLEVVEVNVEVNDVHVPGTDDEDDAESRVA